MAGRKPKPTHLKLIEGNPGKRSLPQSEPVPREAFPVKPKFARPAASECWDRVVVELEAMRILASVDRDALQVYCEAYGTWLVANRRAARSLLVNRGSKSNPVWVSNPAWRIARDAASLMLRIGEAFGLTPSARSRIEAPGVDGDSLEEILDGGG